MWPLYEDREYMEYNGYIGDKSGISMSIDQIACYTMFVPPASTLTHSAAIALAQYLLPY